MRIELTEMFSFTFLFTEWKRNSNCHDILPNILFCKSSWLWKKIQASNKTIIPNWVTTMIKTALTNR